MSWGAGLHVPAGGQLDAAAYDAYLGRWSRLFVPSLLAAAAIDTGHRVLDVATGSGVAARLALAKVGDGGLVVGADISRPMIEAAATRLSHPAFHTVVCDGQSLAFRDRSFDAVVCQLGLMFFPDPARGLSEFRRVLRPGGRAAVCVLGSADRAPMWGVLADTLSRHLPDQARTLQLSFALADSVRLKEMFRAANFSEIRVSTETREARMASFDEYWAPIEAGAGQMPQAYLALPDSSRQSVRDEVRARLATFESDGSYSMNVEMWVAAGRA